MIGDVHGCFYTLKALMAKLPTDANIIFVGDLVDKGNFSKEVVEFVMDGNYQCILGNHEVLMIENIEEVLIDKQENAYSIKKYYGGYKTIHSYESDLLILKKHITWMKTLPQFIEIDQYFITHGFALPYYKRRNLKSSYRALMSNRPCDVEEWGHDWEENFAHYDIINIYGHEPVKEIDTTNNDICIDTGVFTGHKLSAIALKSKTIISVSTDKRDII